MRYNELSDTLQKLIGTIPTQATLAKVLQINPSAMGNRVQRNSKFTPEELRLIEDKYGIDLTGTSQNESLITLNYYPNVFGSCGTGLMVFDECAEKMTITKDSIEGYSASKQYSIINARGSSMSPRIEDNDKLVIQHCIDEQIIDDNVYLFRYNNELFIKRLVKNVDQIVCISENPRFSDRVIEPKEDNFAIVGKVVGLFRSKV